MPKGDLTALVTPFTAPLTALPIDFTRLPNPYNCLGICPLEIGIIYLYYIIILHFTTILLCLHQIQHQVVALQLLLSLKILLQTPFV